MNVHEIEIFGATLYQELEIVRKLEAAGIYVEYNEQVVYVEIERLNDAVKIINDMGFETDEDIVNK